MEAHLALRDLRFTQPAAEVNPELSGMAPARDEGFLVCAPSSREAGSCGSTTPRQLSLKAWPEALSMEEPSGPLNRTRDASIPASTAHTRACAALSGE